MSETTNAPNEQNTQKNKEVPAIAKPATEKTATDVPATEQTATEQTATEQSEDTINFKQYSSYGIFLGICFLLYYVISSFWNKGNNPNPEGSGMGLSRTLDMLFFVIVGIISYNIYNSYQENPDDGIFKNNFNKIKNYVVEPSSAFTTGIFIVMFYVLVKVLGLPTDKDTKPFFISLIEGGSWLLLIIILFVDFFKYVLKISIYDLFPFLADEEEKPEEIPEEPDDKNTPKLEKCEKEKEDDPTSEVFNVSNNSYTYKDAKAICKSYDAELATYNQVENAYNNGAEWCGYGWSDNQMILFPTQKNTWDKLQKLDEKYKTGWKK